MMRLAVVMMSLLPAVAQCDPPPPPPAADADAPTGSKCGQWFDEALTAGWSPEQWPILDAIMWRESRCDPTVYNGRGRDRSYGLLQLNMKAHRAWVSPLVDADFTRLWDPVTNLTVGRALFTMAETQMGCGWQPWVTRRTRVWCHR
jgi:hypothetical protein